jgi:colanic acid/amylovoran biosynthesis glycosyltransferase
MPSENPIDSRSLQTASFPRTISVAYLTSQYPMLSMSFMLREVVELRSMGIHIDVASINNQDRPAERMTAEEAIEARDTYYLKGHGLKGAVGAHTRTLLTNFVGYLRGVRMAFRLGGLDLRRFFYHLMYLTQALMVGVWMKRKQQRHLHVHLGSQAATVGMYVQRIFGMGFSITVHGPDEFYDVPGHNLTEKVAVADFICCISFYARSQLMKFSPYAYWDKLLVSRLGVDTERFSRSAVNNTPETFAILSVGRMVPAKGQHLLLDAVERLAEQGRRVRLHLVGTGPDEASLRQRVSQFKDPEVVVFEGPVNQDRIRVLYEMAHMFCIPSFAEGIPVVLMEALAMEVPCVTTQITGIPELIRPGQDGLLVAPSDLDGLTEALARMMDDPGLRERLSKSGRARVVEHYNLRRNMEKLAAIFVERVRD